MVLKLQGEKKKSSEMDKFINRFERVKFHFGKGFHDDWITIVSDRLSLTWRIDVGGLILL